MDDLNTLALTARLTRDPETRGNGNVLAMRLAFTASKKVGDAWEEAPQYVDAVVFGRQAEALSRLLAKGDQVAVSGRLSWREWQANDGTTRQAHEVIADRVRLISRPKGREDAPAPAPRSDFPIMGEPENAPKPAPVTDMEIPF